MKTFLLIIIFVFGVLYYFVPNDTKLVFFNKVGIDSSFLVSESEQDEQKVNGGLVEIKIDANNKSVYKGNISNGIVLSDNSWASLPYVKCFKADELTNFNGNVVFHRVMLPKSKNINVMLTKDAKATNLSMYVYKTKLNNDLPPALEYVYDCKNDYSANDSKTIIMNGNSAPSEVIIGVTGANGAMDGGYTLELEQK